MRARLLAPTPDNSYTPLGNNAKEALKAGTYTIIEPQKTSFIYLPETDDLMMLEGYSAHFIVPLSRLTPACQYPIDEALQSQSIDAFINERMGNRNIISLADKAVDVVSRSKGYSFYKACPAYRCRASLIEDTKDYQKYAQLKLYDAHSYQTEPFSLKLIAPANAVSYWMDFADHAFSSWSMKSFSEAIGLTGDLYRGSIRRVRTTVHIPLTAEEAIKIRDMRSLSEPFGLMAVFDDHTILDFAAQLQPEGTEAEKVFMTDFIIDRIRRLSPDTLCKDKIMQISAEIMEQKGISGISPETLAEDVLDRLWSRRDFGLIYRLRESEDFLTYDR